MGQQFSFACLVAMLCYHLFFLHAIFLPVFCVVRSMMTKGENEREDRGAEGQRDIETNKTPSTLSLSDREKKSLFFFFTPS